MGNQETGLGWSLKLHDTSGTGRRAEPLEREKQPKAARESDHPIASEQRCQSYTVNNGVRATH